MSEIPNFLAAQARWLLWREVVRNGKRTKVPISFHTGKSCDVTAPGSWTDYAKVDAALARSPGAWDGPGFALGVIEPIGEVVIGLDIDTCLDADGNMAEWAQPFLDAMPTYAEISPSGTGIKVIARIRFADLPAVRRVLEIPEGTKEQARTRIFGERVNGQHAPSVQLFLGARYFTITGRRWTPSPDDVTLLGLEQIERLAQLFGRRPASPRANGGGHEADDDDTAPDEAALRAKLDAALAHNPRLKARWEGGTEGLNDTTRSGRDMSILALLVTAGFTKGEIRAALHQFEYGKAATEPARYFEQMWARTGAAPRPEPVPPSDRTTIKVIKGAYVAAAETIETIATAAQLPIYSHGETLCRPVIEQRKRYDGEKVTVAVLRNYNTASLRRAINPAIGFSKFNARARAFVACEPPAEIINMVLAGAQKQVFPPIRGTLATPILRPDHTIVTTPGYDAATGYYLVGPPDMPPIPAPPTRADAGKALGILADLLSEFPFVDDVSRSVAYSGLITPLVRAACDVVPGHLFTAPKQGSGKSLLVDVASAIATGERAYAILAHRQPEEQDKQLTGALLEARQIIALDNLSGEIESAVLAQATEREHLSLRPLGGSQTVAVLNGFNCYLTGNNVSLGGDNTRRILVGRVDPQVENPLDRTFQKPNPVDRVFAARGEFVAACLVIVLAYLAEGRPNRLPPTPSYAAWSALVREPLVWLGLPDPTDSMRTAFDDDPTNATLATLMAAWPTGQTDWTCAELIDAAQQMDEVGPRYPGLAEALKPLARDRRGIFDVVTLGNYLRSNRDKIVGGRKISRRPTIAHAGAARWFLA